MSAAETLTDGPAAALPAPTGIPVRAGRLHLARARHALPPDGTIAVVAGFGTACWLEQQAGDVGDDQLDVSTRPSVDESLREARIHLAEVDRHLDQPDNDIATTLDRLAHEPPGIDPPEPDPGIGLGL